MMLPARTPFTATPPVPAMLATMASILPVGCTVEPLKEPLRVPVSREALLPRSVHLEVSL